MSLKNLFLASAAATLIAGSAMAAEPITLTDSQMDAVNGGFTLNLLGGVGIAGPVVGLNNNTFNSTSQGEVATVNNVSIGTSVTSLRQTQAIGLNQITSTSTSGGGLAFSAGTLAIGLDATVTAP